MIHDIYSIQPLSLWLSYYQAHKQVLSIIYNALFGDNIAVDVGIPPFLVSVSVLSVCECVCVCVCVCVCILDSHSFSLSLFLFFPLHPHLSHSFFHSHAQSVLVMREPNFSFPAQNRATVVISSALYDRRALDCTATLPLVNSLTHLAYMTSTSPRIREILAADGGLERLVKILATCQHTDRHSLWKWSLAFQCVVNVGVRGTEAIRSRVVETGAVQVVLSILENFLHALEQARNESEQERNHQQQQQHQQQQSIPPSSNVSLTAAAATMLPPTQSRSTPIITSSTITSPSPRSLFSPTALNNSNNNEEEESSLSSISIERPFASPPRRRTFLTRSPKQKFKPADPSLSSIPMLNNLSSDAVLHREEDILLSLQLLAYLSKYPHIRESFHKNYRRNIFSVVERFTYRLHPTNVTYWAGVIMRNACRKDEARGGIRQCAYMHCGKWERFPREFAKCRRW